MRLATGTDLATEIRDDLRERLSVELSAQGVDPAPDLRAEIARGVASFLDGLAQRSPLEGIDPNRVKTPAGVPLQTYWSAAALRGLAALLRGPG